MSVAYPIFPGFKPGQSMTAPPLPIRAPTWNYKESLHFQNYGQVAVSGRKTVTKYWSNPLHSWEWKYGYIKDSPTDHNNFYPVAVPSTDFQMLEAFYAGMQGSGNQFAYEPPYYQVGGTWPVTAVSIAGNLVTFTAAGAGTALASSIGLPLQALNTAVGAIDGQYMYIASVSGANTVVCKFVTSPTSGGSGGVITLGQVLTNPDSNDNVELVYTLGAYPTLSGQSYGGSVVPVTESVQLIDTATLVVYDGAGTNITSDMTLAVPNSVTPPLAYMPYVGYVLQFGSFTPAVLPLTAKFNMYYLSRFSEDTLEADNFLTLLWSVSTFKFEQDRL